MKLLGYILIKQEDYSQQESLLAEHRLNLEHEKMTNKKLRMEIEKLNKYVAKLKIIRKEIINDDKDSV